jgi:hypothetical protein
MGVIMNLITERSFGNIAPDHGSRLVIIAEYLVANPTLAPKCRRNEEFGSQEYWERLGSKFIRGRSPRTPVEPTTVPDPMVGIILQEYFGLDARSIEQVVREHSISMAAENIVGDLLERYIASELESYGWIWCSGEVVKKVDFLAAKVGATSEWIPVQVKNRDNSENSSSSSVREGTEIVKWFRTFSRTGLTNWSAFPERLPGVSLTEESFEVFARNYLRELATSE